jgi:hypothetical protein
MIRSDSPTKEEWMPIRSTPMSSNQTTRRLARAGFCQV